MTSFVKPPPQKKAGTRNIVGLEREKKHLLASFWNVILVYSIKKMHKHHLQAILFIYETMTNGCTEIKCKNIVRLPNARLKRITVNCNEEKTYSRSGSLVTLHSLMAREKIK